MITHPPSGKRSTSKAAAESMVESATTLRGLVYDTLLKHPKGLTTDEVEVLLDMRHQTISARMWELEKRGQIGDTGRRRMTRSKRMARVMRVLTAAEMKAQEAAIQGKGEGQ